MSETAGQALRRIMEGSVDIKTTVPRFTGLIYGNNGVGKTIFSVGLINRLTSPERKKIILIDTSENWVSLKNHPRISDNVHVIPFTSMHDLRVVAKAIHQGVGLFSEVGGIVIDQGSSAYQKTLDEDFMQRVGSGPNPDNPVPEWADYNQSLFKYRTALTDLTNIPYLHIITTAHVSENKNKKGEVINRYPNFSPAVLNRVKEDLSLVGYMSAREMRDPNDFDKNVYERIIQVHPTSLYDAKTKVPDLPIRLPIRDFVSATVEWVDAGAPEAPVPTAHEALENQAPVVVEQEESGSEVETESESEIEIESSVTEDELDFDNKPIIIE